MKERQGRPFEQHREERMNHHNRKGSAGIVTATAMALMSLAGSPAGVSAQSMADYTNYPIFLSQTVPPNILFLVDMGNFTLEAAYSGAGHKYPISFKSGTATDSKYAANVTLTASSGPSLVAVTDTGVSIDTTIVTSPADVFDHAKSYYGIFDSLRCYSTDANSFIYGSKKTSVTDTCGASHWDGNFMNWLTQRKKEMIYQVLVGGKPLPAQSNQDGTANSLAGEPKTGEDGSTSSCNNNSSSCWRYVKYVPNGAFSGRVPSTLPVPTVNRSGGTITTGAFFGIGEGRLYVNDDATPNPFDNAPGMRWNIKIDLTTEPNVPAGSGTQTNCIDGDPNYAGALACYKRERSLGLFQKMRMDNMHVAIMFVNADTGQGGSLQFPFDGNFNASTVTNIRNEQIEAYSPIAEALYEGLCLFRKSQGPCYSNSGSWSTGYSSGGIGSAGDPFYFASMNQMVRCAKCFVLMISPGIGVRDGDAPNLQQPFGDLFSGTNIGVDFTQAPWSMTAPEAKAAGDRLDDVAYYGRRHDLRSDLQGKQNVFFYAVNAMGGPRGAALLASASKYGGFEDRNNDNAVDLAGTQSCTYPVGSNLGSGSSTSNPEWDLDQDCVPDTYFDASEGGDLEAQINKAIAAILKKAASGTSISVLASSSTGEGSLFQAFFYPNTYEGNREIKWLGFVQGLFVDPFGNLREDRGGPGGGPDGKLVYGDDNIVVTRIDDDSGDVVVDRYADANADGMPDSTTPYETVSLRQMQGIWEAGKKLALRDVTSSPRKLITWVDLNNDGIVDSGEQMDFSTANANVLRPYLRASTTGTYTAANIINFVHGVQVPDMRDRRVTVDGQLRVWKLGDVVNSTPTIVGAPKERYDILYGDSGYRNFVRRWANRRQMAYVGANDGMLHAFNSGYYHRGDDPSTSNIVEHGWYTTGPSDNSSGVGLGEEVWGFVPYQLLPQLMWYSQPDYTHISYVDLKPKVTDVRIFTPEAACGAGATPTAPGCIHPDGWGTILIGGLRFGGSCGSCAAVTGGNNGGPAFKVVADFNGNGNTTDVNDTRYFYSAYFVLDITDPEAEPSVIGVYSATDLGLTTSYPAVVRMNLSSDLNTDHTNSKWFMVLGSGAHGYDGRAAAVAKMFAVELGAPLGTAPAITKMTAGTWNAFMGDPISVDRDLDFRTDAIFVGGTIDPGPTGSGGSGRGLWTGKMYRLTMGTCIAVPCSTSSWGIASGGNRIPTEMLDTFAMTSGTKYLGPVTSSPTVTLDDTGEVWLFFGTGRFLSAGDKANTDTQYLVGLKDSVLRLGGCVQSNTTNCLVNNLLDVSSAQICVSCATGSNQVNGISGVTTFPGLLTLMLGKDGWVTSLPTAGERSLVPPTIIAGAVLFPTFIPTNDICVAAGDSNLYALFYKTGSAYPEPIIGVDAAGVSQRSMSLGQGLASSVAIQIGAAPTGVAGFYQTSGANIGRLSPQTPLSAWSQYVSWISERT